MRRLSLEQFMIGNPNHSYIKERVGSTTYEIYARKGPRGIDGQILSTIDLANIITRTPGRGNFPALIERVKELARRFDYHGIYVESVTCLNPRFIPKLKELGFRQVNTNYRTSNYYIEGESHAILYGQAS